jgi:hypothetical protein
MITCKKDYSVCVRLLYKDIQSPLTLPNISNCIETLKYRATIRLFPRHVLYFDPKISIRAGFLYW